MTDMDKPTPAERAEALRTLLEVEELDRDLYRGARDPQASGRIFGGQVVGQALRAAQGSVSEDRCAHSLHAYFLRAGDDALPVIYRVGRDLDGGSFSNRRIIAQQRGKVILNMTASFARREEGLSHQDDMPDVPPPSECRSPQELAEGIDLPERARAFLDRPRPFETRLVDTRMYFPMGGEPVHHMWFRLSASVGEDPQMNKAALAYASDYSLLGTSMIPHSINWLTPGTSIASLDHAVWFHGDVQMDDWHLYTTDSPWSGGGRGFNRGRVFTQAGKLVADVSQEGLIRYTKPEKKDG